MRLIEEGEARAGFGGDGQAIVADDVACEAARAAKAHNGAIFTLTKHCGAVRRFNHVGHVASGADISDTYSDAIVEDIKQFAYKNASVKRDGFAGFEIDFKAGFGADRFDELDQVVALVIGASDVMSATEVQPLKLAEIGCDLWLERFPRAFEWLKILLAQRVKWRPDTPSRCSGNN
jgi:hypothetical protein